MATNGERKIYDDKLADSHDQETVLKGILPKNFLAYQIYKVSRNLFFATLFIFALAFGFTYLHAFEQITTTVYYKYGLIGLLVLAVSLICFAILVRLIFLRKAPFDSWVYEISQKRLGTEVIFYDSKCIYIQYDRGGKEVDKREFVTEMTDKSEHFSYFYIKTFIDRGVIQVECTRKQPIPKMALFKEDDDKYWNIVPLGLTINNTTQKVAPIGWYLNDNNKNPEAVEVVPSTSILICGSTGCYIQKSLILMYNSIER